MEEEKSIEDGEKLDQSKCHWRIYSEIGLDTNISTYKLFFRRRLRVTSAMEI